MLIGVRDGDAGTSRRGVKLGRGFDQLEVFESGVAVAFASLVGDTIGVKGFAGELRGCLVGEVGVVGRRTVDGEAGDSGRRKGEALGEPYESGEGLYRDYRFISTGPLSMLYSKTMHHSS